MIVVSSEGELVYFMFFLLPLPGHSVNSGMSLNVSPQERMQQRWSLGRSACSLQPTGDTECRSAASSITPLLQPAGRVPRNPDVSHGLSFLPLLGEAVSCGQNPGLGDQRAAADVARRLRLETEIGERERHQRERATKEKEQR